MSLRDLEKELLAPKHWTLGGEVEGKQRPENALLDEDVQFPRKADVGREVREELLSMEDAGDDAAAQDAEPATAHDALLRIIKCRISAQAFDDVVYMQPPQKEKKLEDILSTVDTAKPTQTLTETYVTEKLIRGAAGTSEVEKAENACLMLWKSLKMKLDQLTS